VTSTTAAPTTTTKPAPTTTSTTRPHDGTLAAGATGAAVQALEERLVALGYWLGAPDGTFDDATHHAVVAFQKLSGLERDGIVGPRTRAALAAAVRPGARSTAGLVVEIDLERQVLLVARDGVVEWVFDTSTGAVPGTTPRGTWEVEREIDGYHRSRLGVLYRPKYFHGGVAVHGYPNVPPYPASHGCVRVINVVMDELWSSGALAIGTPVLVS
jgi:hypothetical protein